LLSSAIKNEKSQNKKESLMKRVRVSVIDPDANGIFYSTVCGVIPTLRKPDAAGRA